MNNYTVHHREEPWTGLRETTDKIIVHTRNKQDVSTPRALDAYFRRRGYLCCGYHYVLTASGVHVMRHPESIGAAHADHDQTAVYIAILNFDGKTMPVPKQLEGPLVSLLHDLSTRYPAAEILSAPALLGLEGYDLFTRYIEARNDARHRK